MPRPLSSNEMKDELTLEYSSIILDDSRNKRLHNIKSFNGIKRNNLSYNSAEKRLILYSTLQNEAVGIQFPGKESVEKTRKPYDFVPIIQINGKNLSINMSFGDIWDIFTSLAKAHKDYLCYIAALVYDMGYLQRYDNTKGNYRFELVDVKNDSVLITGQESLDWYRMNISDDLWYTLNDWFGPVVLENGQSISIEAFIKYVDLLMQNEDCKYHYINTIINPKENYERTLNNGRIGSSHANLLVLNYLQEKEKLSDMIDSFQKGKGTAGFRKADYQIVTNDIVINIDVL